MPARTLKLLVVGLDWPPEPFIAQLLDGVRSRGIEVTVATSGHPEPGAVDEWVALPGDGAMPWRSAARLARRAPLRLARAAFGPTRSSPGGASRRSLGLEALRTADADVIYVPWTATAIHLPEVFDLGPPVVVSCRGSQVNVAPWNPDRPEIRSGLPAVFRRAAAVHCVSDAIALEAHQHGLARGQGTVIRPAVDLRRFSWRWPRAGNGPLRLVSIGSVAWPKGIEYALLAVRRLLDQDVNVLYEIVGPELDGGAVRHAVHDLDLRDHVRLTGRVDPGDVPGHLGRADVLVLPSLTEGIANVAIEAMASGRPVVVTNCGGMPETVRDGLEGYVVPPRDPAALSDAIRSLRDPEARTRTGRAGRARAETHHDLSKQLTAYVELFEHVRRSS